MSRGVKEWKADTAAFSLLQLMGTDYSNGFPNDSFQSAYRAGHSMETVLLHIVNDILSALDNDNIFVLLLLDLSAAFDTTDHQILLSRLNCVFGIQSTAFQWFQSYLSDRYQSTSVSNSSSSPSQLMYGVP